MGVSNKFLTVGMAITTLVILLLAKSAQAQEWVYTVVEGDTLSEFSQKYLYKTSYWKQLQRINNIVDPKRIPTHTKLRVPIKWIRSQPAAAKAIKIEGTASLIKQGSEVAIPLAETALLELGDELKSNPQSSVLIRFADGSEMTVQQNSRIQFNYMREYGETGMVDSRVRLISGELETRAQPQRGGGARLEIETPAAVSAVRGTEFRTAYSAESQSANIEVLEGGVAVKGGKSSKLIRAGYGTKVKKGKAPLPPKKLLPPVTLDNYPDPIEQVGYEMSWKPLKQAKSYKALIADSNLFSTVISNQISPRNRINLPDLKDGTYYIQIRATDTLGIEGLNRVQAFTLNARPQPPFPVAPTDKEVFRGKTPQLEWTNSSDADNYRLEIATDSTFQNLVISESEITSVQYNAYKLSPTQTYYWRLASIASDGEQGPYSAPRSLTVKPIPATPEPKLEQTDDTVRLSWNGGAGGQTYQVQIARDKHFQTILNDTAVDQPEIKIPRPSGYRYIRVRTLAADGFAGAWGGTQELIPAPNENWIYIFGSTILMILLI